jgi:hypothetical protein
MNICDEWKHGVDFGPISFCYQPVTCQALPRHMIWAVLCTQFVSGVGEGGGNIFSYTEILRQHRYSVLYTRAI